MQTGDRDAKGNLSVVQVRLRFMTFIVFSKYTNGLSKSKQSVHVFLSCTVKRLKYMCF